MVALNEPVTVMEGVLKSPVMRFATVPSLVIINWLLAELAKALPAFVPIRTLPVPVVMGTPEEYPTNVWLDPLVKPKPAVYPHTEL